MINGIFTCNKRLVAARGSVSYGGDGHPHLGLASVCHPVDGVEVRPPVPESPVLWGIIMASGVGGASEEGRTEFDLLYFGMAYKV